MPHNIEYYISPEGDRMLYIDRVTGNVWFSRYVIFQSEKTELLNAARTWSAQASVKLVKDEEEVAAHV